MNYVDKKLIRHIESHPCVEWDWNVLSMHENLNACTLEHFKDKPWNYNLLSTHPNFSFAWVEILTPDKPWDWYNTLSKSEKLTMNIVLKYIHKSWNWTLITLNNNINDDDMINNPTLPWQFNELGYMNIGFNELKILRFFRNRFDAPSWRDFTTYASWVVIKTNLDIPWDTACIQFEADDISTKDDLDTLKYFMDDGKWLDWNAISICADIHLIYTHSSEFPWVWKYVSMNPSVRHEDTLVSNIIPWNYHYVPLESDEDALRVWNSAKIIQRHWKRCITDPTHSICKRRLEYEFNNMCVHNNNDL